MCLASQAAGGLRALNVNVHLLARSADEAFHLRRKWEILGLIMTWCLTMGKIDAFVPVIRGLDVKAAVLEITFDLLHCDGR